MTKLMEKQKFKQTEIGEIPEDWRTEKLGNESALITKGTTPTSIGKNFISSGVNFIKVESLCKNGFFNTEMFAFIDNDTHSLLKRSQLKKNDLLISIAGALGRTGIVSEDILPANTNQALAIARLKENSSLNLNYIFHFLRTKAIAKHIETISVQGAQPNLSLQNINDMPINAPLLIQEQTAIATVLSDTDELIISLDKLITKKKAIKQGAMQELLTGKKRLPGFEKQKGFKQTEIGEIPEDWGIVFIAKITREIFLGLTSKVDYVLSRGFPLVRATDIAEGKLNFEKARMISSEQHKMLTRYRKAKFGDILVSKSGSLGVCALVNTDIEFSIYESIIVIQPKEDIDSKFLLWLMRDERTQTRMIGEKVGSTIGHLNIEIFRKLIIPIPSSEEQTAIATVLSDMDSELESLEKKRDKYLMIKQGMMQQLLTGKIRLI
jgi:type I restriction enzyme S subunit